MRCGLYGFAGRVAAVGKLSGRAAEGSLYIWKARTAMMSLGQHRRKIDVGAQIRVFCAFKCGTAVRL